MSSSSTGEPSDLDALGVKQVAMALWNELQQQVLNENSAAGAVSRRVMRAGSNDAERAQCLANLVCTPGELPGDLQRLLGNLATALISEQGAAEIAGCAAVTAARGLSFKPYDLAVTKRCEDMWAEATARRELVMGMLALHCKGSAPAASENAQAIGGDGVDLLAELDTTFADTPTDPSIAAEEAGGENAEPRVHSNFVPIWNSDAGAGTVGSNIVHLPDFGTTPGSSRGRSLQASSQADATAVVALPSPSAAPPAQPALASVAGSSSIPAPTVHPAAVGDGSIGRTKVYHGSQTVYHLDSARHAPCEQPQAQQAFSDKYMKAVTSPFRSACAIYKIPVGRCDSFDDLYQKLACKDRDILIVSNQVRGDAMILVMKGTAADQRKFKPLASASGINYELFYVHLPNRGGNKALEEFKIKLLSDFMQLGSADCNVEITDAKIGPSIDAKMVDEYFKDFSEEEYNLAFMNALIKQRRGGDGELNEYEQCMLIPRMDAKIKELRKERMDFQRACSSCVFKLEGEPPNRIPDVERHRDFTPGVDALVYRKFDPDTGKLENVSDQVIDTTAMWKQFAQMINGDAGIGKTPLQISKAKMYCRRRGKAIFVKVKGSVEPLVILSKKGVLAMAGAVILEDFALQSVRGDLTEEDLKTLFDVRDGGTIESKRWGHIDFPPGLPRLFAFNAPATTLLKIFADPSSHAQAQLKRVCIAGYDALVTTPLISKAGKKMAKQAHDDDNDADFERERQWWAQRGDERFGLPAGSMAADVDEDGASPSRVESDTAELLQDLLKQTS